MSRQAQPIIRSISRKYQFQHFPLREKQVSPTFKSFHSKPSQQYYLAADYFLMPSLMEPSGISQQEAFMYSCPVIAYCTGGLRETVVDVSRNPVWGNGFLFYNYSPQSLKDILTKVRVTRPINLQLTNPNCSRKCGSNANWVCTPLKTLQGRMCLSSSSFLIW
jgi:hypothetical protein